MLAAINIHPKKSKGRDKVQTLPYEALRVDLDCHHSGLYLIQTYEDGPLLCGLCFFRDGYQTELPPAIHFRNTLAENGNPETVPLFMSHLQLVMGLEAPKPDQDLVEFRKKRIALAREQYTVRAPKQFGHKLSTHTRRAKFSSPSKLYPIASSLWKLMGYQPPLGVVLVRGVSGRTESEIADELDVSQMNVHTRMAKAIRTALGYLPREGAA